MNFEAIKTELVNKGLATQQMADSATQQVIFIKGEWNRDGSATIKETSAGWLIGDFPKVLPAQIEVPAVQGFNKSQIEQALATAYEGATIIVKIS